MHIGWGLCDCLCLVLVCSSLSQFPSSPPPSVTQSDNHVPSPPCSHLDNHVPSPPTSHFPLPRVHTHINHNHLEQHPLGDVRPGSRYKLGDVRTGSIRTGGQGLWPLRRHVLEEVRCQKSAGLICSEKQNIFAALRGGGAVC